MHTRGNQHAMCKDNTDNGMRSHDSRTDVVHRGLYHEIEADTEMRTILIVDDSLTVRMELAEALERAGFHTIQCATIADARIALRSHSIALAILDIQLPDGDGVDLLVQIRKDFTLGELPVLLLSTEAEVRDRIRGLRGGANDFVGKPYDTFQIGRASWRA